MYFDIKPLLLIFRYT